MKRTLAFFILLIFSFGCQKLEYFEQPQITLLTFNGSSPGNFEFRVGNGGQVNMVFDLRASKGVKELRAINIGFDDGGSLVNRDVTSDFTISLEEGSEVSEATVQFMANYDQYADGIVSDYGKYRFDFYVVDEMGAVSYVSIKLIP